MEVSFSVSQGSSYTIHGVEPSAVAEIEKATENQPIFCMISAPWYCELLIVIFYYYWYWLIAVG